ncbi:MAG: hypothetical protein AAFQ04_01670 [Pseudomonadota bacterium]
MNEDLHTAVTTLAMAMVNAIGTVALKLTDGSHKEQFFAAAIVAYIIGAALYVSLLKENSLAVMAVASSTLQLGLMISLSVWYFGEKINLVQGSAMTVAVVAAAVAMLAATH